jgi:GNAT superfamily N-acetyltransferase
MQRTTLQFSHMEYKLTLTDVADDALRQLILAPLVEYNASQAGPSQGRPVVIALTDNEGEVIGGLWGHTGYEWLFTQLLVVPDTLRGRGVGSDIMRLAEQEAVQRGCHNAWLDTFEFQARGFYERIGYQCFGELPDYPKGHSRFFMKKALAKTERSLK